MERLEDVEYRELEDYQRAAHLTFVQENAQRHLDARRSR
jgi:hypothetical protein